MTPLAGWLSAQGVEVVYSDVVGERKPLVFTGHGPKLPSTRLASSLLSTDWILIPGLVFDAQGARFGFGGGYYDRTLALTQARRIGVFFGVQKAHELPTLDHDIPMDALLTERCFDWVSREPSFTERL